MASLSLENGTVMEAFSAFPAFFIIINIAAIGSVIKVLPARLAYARDHPFVCKLAEANTAKAEIAHKAVSSAALKTSVCCPSAEFLLLL